MRIAAIETINVEAFSNLVWVRVHTDDGLIGLGETFRNPQAVIAYVHETCAPYLLGKDPLHIERHHAALMSRVVNHFNGFPTRCIEIRGNSAVDLALWDIFGKAMNCPLYQLLGGLTHERTRVYNTCVGYSYDLRASSDLHPEHAIRKSLPEHGEAAEPYEDLEAQFHSPGALAQSLLADGVNAMKIWPFSAFALAKGGWEISSTDLRSGVAIVEAIRTAVGGKMDILLEMQGFWHLAPALAISRALADYGIYWFEDPVPPQNIGDLALYSRSIEGRVAGSENLGSRAWYREAFARQAVDVANFDIGWIGGLTEGRKIAALAETFDRPVSPHSCTGPVVLAANVHLMTAVSNSLLAETVRALYRGFYREMVTVLPKIVDGWIFPTTDPGLGTELSPGLLRRPDTSIRVTKAD